MRRHRGLKSFYTALVLIFLYAPIATLMVLSFNSSKSRSHWGGFTLDWYASLISDDAITTAFSNTIIIALLSALIATVFGTLACLGMMSMRKRYRALIMGMTNIPMLNADIVTGISLMLLFIACRATMGAATVLMAHITFNIPLSYKFCLWFL